MGYSPTSGPIRVLLHVRMPGPRSSPGAEVILLALPVLEAVRRLGERGPALCMGQIVVDVGSTKRAVLEAMDRLSAGVEAIGSSACSDSPSARGARPSRKTTARDEIAEREREPDEIFPFQAGHGRTPDAR